MDQEKIATIELIDNINARIVGYRTWRAELQAKLCGYRGCGGRLSGELTAGQGERGQGESEEGKSRKDVGEGKQEENPKIS